MQKITLFNGTSIPRITTRIENIEGTFRLTATDIMLKEMHGESVIKSSDGILELDHPVPVGGMLYLDRVS